VTVVLPLVPVTPARRRWFGGLAEAAGGELREGGGGVGEPHVRVIGGGDAAALQEEDGAPPAIAAWARKAWPSWARPGTARKARPGWTRRESTARPVSSVSPVQPT
jgi:hypothetical protein